MSSDPGCNPPAAVKSDPKAEDSGTWLNEALTTLAAFTMFLGPGTSAAFYIVTVGYYEYRFETKALFPMMRLATYGPFPLITALQAVFDSYFDMRFTTHTTYPFRIFTGLLLLQILVTMWMYLPAKEGVVIGIGFALGASCCVVQASGHQLIMAIDPTKLTWAELGSQFGCSLPILILPMLDFKPTATVDEFRELIATVVIVNFLAMALLLVLHLRGLFYEAYDRLASDLDTDQSGLQDSEEEAATALRRQVSEQAVATRMFDEPVESSYRAVSRQATPASRQLTPEPPRAAPEPEEQRSPREPSSEGVPGWVYRWVIATGLMQLTAAFIVSLAGLYGDPAHTQFLASTMLAAAFVGRASALPLVRSKHFTGPWHRFFVVSVVVRVVMVAVMLAQLFRPVLTRPAFVVVWCLFGIYDRLAGMVADVTCGTFVEMKDRRFVSRLTFICGFGGMILGFGAAFMFAVLMADRVDRSAALLLREDIQGPPHRIARVIAEI